MSIHLLPLFSVPVLLAAGAPSAPLPEPDGSLQSAETPAFQGSPAPPAWLRGISHARAFVDTRKYLYEAYAGPDGEWLVRYVMLPEGNEAFREIEQAFLFGSDPAGKPRELKPAEIVFDPTAAELRGRHYALVDRRFLTRP